jgi:hypothetical protein
MLAKIDPKTVAMVVGGAGHKKPSLLLRQHSQQTARDGYKSEIVSTRK